MNTSTSETIGFLLDDTPALRSFTLYNITGSESITLIDITNTLVMIVHSSNELYYWVTAVYLEHVVYIRYWNQTTCSR